MHQLRVLAVIAMAAAHFQIGDAVMGLAALAVAFSQEMPANPHDFLWRNARKFINTGAVCDMPRSGRDPKVPRRVLRRCCNRFKAGYHDAQGKRHWYASIEEALLKDYYIKHAVHKYGVRDVRSTLFARMLELDPFIVRRTRTVKRQYTPAHLEARVRVAKELLDKGPDYHLGTIFLDAKKGYIKPADMRVWCDKSEPDNGEFLIRTKDVKCQKKFFYYIAVNAYLGAVWMGFVTGSVGVKRGYKVSDGDKWPVILAAVHKKWLSRGSAARNGNANQPRPVRGVAIVQAQHTEPALKRVPVQLGVTRPLHNQWGVVHVAMHML